DWAAPGSGLALPALGRIYGRWSRAGVVPPPGPHAYCRTSWLAQRRLRHGNLTGWLAAAARRCLTAMSRKVIRSVVCCHLTPAGGFMDFYRLRARAGIAVGAAALLTAALGGSAMATVQPKPASGT